MSTVPVPYRVVAVRAETADCVSLELDPAGEDLPDDFAPGQFAMVYAFGVGEVPISVSAIAARRREGRGGALTVTVRAVGAVSGALCRLSPGDFVGLRGPCGTGWQVERASGNDLLVIAGGLGLAPLRPVVHQRLGGPGRLAVLVGARTPTDLLYPQELASWRTAAQVEVTVDRPDPAWRGSVGVVTSLLDRVRLDLATATALVCGPEAMMRHTARALRERGVAAGDIRLSLERSMRCGVGHCGHCQLGPLLLCRDGPVVDYATAGPLLSVREL